MKTMIAITLAGLCGVAGAKTAGRSVDGRPLTLVGQGARVKDGDKLYDMQMWIDEEDGRRAFPALAMRASGRDKAHLTRGDHGPGFLVWGRFTKQAIFKFARAVPAATMRDDIKSALEEIKGAAEVAALFAVDADAGDEKDDRKEGPQSPKLERALWNVWLGPKPLSVDLRRALIERLVELGR
jgi:hypothetical protein